MKSNLSRLDNYFSHMWVILRFQGFSKKPLTVHFGWGVFFEPKILQIFIIVANLLSNKFNGWGCHQFIKERTLLNVGRDALAKKIKSKNSNYDEQSDSHSENVRGSVNHKTLSRNQNLAWRDVQFSASTWWLTAIRNNSSRGPYSSSGFHGH